MTSTTDAAADAEVGIRRPDAFVSYSRTDEAFVRRLHAALEAAGKELWIDWEDIRPSADWLQRVHAAIESARAVVAVLSPDAARSQACRDEVAHAVHAGKRLIPIVRRDVRPEDVGEALARPNWIWMREGEDFDAGSALVVEALESDFEWRDAHARITMRAAEWRSSSRDPSVLLRGSDLEKAEAWSAAQSDHREQVTREQADFILASRRASGRRQRRALSAVTVALVVAIALAVFAVVQRQTAIDREHQAQSRQLAAEGLTVIDRDPVEALSLAARGLRTARTTEAVDAMRAALMRPRPSAVVKGIVSPNGRRAVTRPAGGLMKIVDVRSGRAIGRLSGHVKELADAQFSPDGAHLAATVRVGGEWTLRLWPAGPHDGSDRVLARGPDRLDVANSPPAFSTDGQRIAGAGELAGVQVWDAASGRRLRTIPDASSPALDRDGRHVVVATGKAIEVRDVATNAVLAHHPVPDVVDQLEFSRDGRRVLMTVLAGSNSGRADAYGYLWSWTADSDFVKVGPHDLWVNRIAVSPDGRRAVTAGEDRIARVWNLRTGRSVALIGHNRAIGSVDFSPDGRLVVSGSEDGSVRVWDPRTGRSLAELRGHVGAVRAEFAGVDRIVTLGEDDGTSRVWPLKLRNLPVAADAAVFGLSDVAVLGAAFSRDGREIVTAGGDQRAVLWNVATGERGRAIRVAAPSSYDGAQATSATFSSDGRALLLSTADGPTKIVDLADGGSSVERYGSSASETGAWWFPPVFDPTGRFVVTARARSEPCRLLDARSGRRLGTLPGTGGVQVPAFSADGRHLVAVESPKQGAAETVRVLAVPSLRIEAELRPPLSHSTLGGAALSSDGRVALIFGLDRAELWDVAARRRRVALTGYSGGVNGAAFSADGRFVVTAGTDGTARVWETTSGHPVAVLSGHSDDVTTVAFSPDGRRVVTGSLDGSALIQECPACRSADELVAIAGDPSTVR